MLSRLCQMEAFYGCMFAKLPTGELGVVVSQFPSSTRVWVSGLKIRNSSFSLFSAPSQPKEQDLGFGSAKVSYKSTMAAFPAEANAIKGNPSPVFRYCCPPLKR